MMDAERAARLEAALQKIREMTEHGNRLPIHGKSIIYRLANDALTGKVRT